MAWFWFIIACTFFMLWLRDKKDASYLREALDAVNKARVESNTPDPRVANFPTNYNTIQKN